MKSTVTFKEYFEIYVEEMTVGGVMGGSTGGFSPSNPTSSDFYAPGDARIATPDQYICTRAGAIKRNKKRAKKRAKRKTKHNIKK